MTCSLKYLFLVFLLKKSVPRMKGYNNHPSKSLPKGFLNMMLLFLEQEAVWSYNFCHGGKLMGKKAQNN